MDATVVDRDGKQVTDLRPEEFSVEVDGDARPVVTADYIKLIDDTPIPIGAPKPGPPQAIAGRGVLLDQQQGARAPAG